MEDGLYGEVAKLRPSAQDRLSWEHGVLVGLSVIVSLLVTQWDRLAMSARWVGTAVGSALAWLRDAVDPTAGGALFHVMLMLGFMGLTGLVVGLVWPLTGEHAETVGSAEADVVPLPAPRKQGQMRRRAA